MEDKKYIIKTTKNEQYKTLRGLILKFKEYNFNWKNFEEYVTNFFRCTKLLKFNFLKRSNIQKFEEDNQNISKLLDEYVQYANNINHKVDFTLNCLITENILLKEEYATVRKILDNALDNSIDFLTNTQEKIYNNYGYNKIVKFKI